jgi:hypothetical protein
MGKAVRFALAALLVIGIMACTTTGAKPTPEDIRDTAYKSLVVAAETYDASMKTLATVAARGIVRPEEVEKIKGYAKIYYDAYQGASLALYTYAAISGVETETRLSTALAEMSKALSEFLTIARPYLSRGTP